MRIHEIMQITESTSFEDQSWRLDNLIKPRRDRIVAFWVTASGDLDQLPNWGHHENAAFAAFGTGDDVNRGNYTQKAMIAGWVLMSGREKEMNFRFVQGCTGAGAKRTIAESIKYVAEWFDAPLSITFEGWPKTIVKKPTWGECSIHQNFTDARKAMGFTRQI